MRDTTTPTPTDPDALLRPDAAAQLIGLTTRYLEARRLRGGGPPYVRISARAIRYRRADVLAWIAARVRTSTADTGAAS